MKTRSKTPLRWVKHYDGPNNTPGLPLLLQAWVELVAKKHICNVCPIGWDHQVLVLFERSKPIGVLSYSHFKHTKEYWINLGYVIPPKRRTGAYTLLWEHLVMLAQEQGVVGIQGSTTRNNKTLRRVAESQGRRELGTYLAYTVPVKRSKK